MPVKQAMLLAAGLSTRVRPLTDVVPKPMLPFWNRMILDFTLAYLKKYGVRSVAVNAHHGREPFLNALLRITELQITPFVEDVQILGTGGGIKNMRPFIQDKTFVVMNCDFITDVNLNAAIAFHKKKKSIATMILIEHPRAKRYGEIGVDAQGRIVNFPYRNINGKPKKLGMFSGIHIFDRDIFNHMPLEKVFCINREVYAPLIEKGAAVFGYVTKAAWLDVGEIKLYAETQFQLLKKHPTWMKPFLRGYTRRPGHVWISKSAQLDPKVRLKGPALISDNAQIGAGVTIGPNAIVGPDAQVGEKSRLKNVIVYPRATVASSIEIANTIVSDGGYVPL